MESVRPASDSNGPVRVGVIGESGVGKSTLVNALLSERLPLLPQGGIGPLTAIPIVVCYARAPYVKVRCLGTERIHELVAACGAAVGGEDARRTDVLSQAQMALLIELMRPTEVELETQLRHVVFPLLAAVVG